MTEKRLFRDALVACLGAQETLTVVGHAGTTEDLLVLCALRAPDVVIVADGGDVRVTQAAATAVREHHPRARVVMVYEHLSPEDLATLWRAGVDTLVPASHGLEALVVLLRRSSGASGAPPGDGLTDREREILALVGAGHTVCRIAALLQTSVHEVENAKRRIYRKLDVASHSQAVARAAALGMMDQHPLPLAPRTVRNTGIPLAVLRGPQSATRQRAVVALLAHGVPFALEQLPVRTAAPKLRGAEAWHRGPTVLVLVEPGPQDWPAADGLRSPVVLVCAGNPGDVDVVDAMSRGLAAVVEADRVTDDLVPALTLAARGYLTLDGARVRTLLAARRRDADAGLPALTSRESDILLSIAAGHTVRQTARSLGIAEKTVENTQARLFRKLGAHNRAGALAAAHGWGLIDIGDAAATENTRRHPAWRYAGRTPA
jgi:DNA-binding NarL/FixJ family response regulator